MKQMKQMLMGRESRDTPYLPEEIVQGILKRLPVRSLIRFQCVSKHWKNLIKSPSPSFITENLRHSTHQNPSLLLCKQNLQNRRSGALHLSLIDCEMHVREVQNSPLLGSLSDVWIVGSCNGVICVGINENDIAAFLLWNPATGEVRQIPRTKSYKLSEWDCTGFGFSAIVNDYKIVQAYDEDNEVTISAIEVYSLSTRSWKEIEYASLEGVIPIGASVTANGCIFWHGLKLEEEEEGGDDNNSVVSFDMAKEVFTLIPGPPRLGNSTNFGLTVYDDKLAILFLSKIGDRPNYLYSLIDLWVLEEGIGSSTERWSWTKNYTSNLCTSTLSFAKKIWRNDIVCASFCKRKLKIDSGGKIEIDDDELGQFLINITTNEGKMFAIPGCYANVFNHSCGKPCSNQQHSLSEEP